MSKLFVELKKVVDNSYEIEIGKNLADTLISDLKNNLVGNVKKIAIITDSNVKPLYADKIANNLIANGFTTDIFCFDAGETSKTRHTKELIEDEMLARGYRRDCAIVAIGGGVVTDLAGFLAGTFGRGVPFVNYATTLLAAADASVGGKTAVDTPLATNLIGIFNQPKKVYIDTATWLTLPSNQLSSGLAETIKHAVMADESFFSYLEQNIEKVFDFDDEVCSHIAQTNCKIKYNVVMQDELENSLREILNLGHTVGRAIETVSEYKLSHGEAVSIGLCAQARLGEKLGFTTSQDISRLEKLLCRARLPICIPDYIDKDALIKKLYTDKKVRDGKLRFVFQKGTGNVCEFENHTYAMPIAEEQIKEIIFAM